MKKKRRLAMLAGEKQAAAKKEAENIPKTGVKVVRMESTV